MTTRGAISRREKTPHWVLVLLPLSAVAGIALTLIAFALLRQPELPPPVQIGGWLNLGSQTDIFLQADQTPIAYNFAADPLRSLILTLDGRTPGFTFGAEVTDAEGRSVAKFDAGLQSAEITLAPDVGIYTIAVSAKVEEMPTVAGNVPIRAGTSSFIPFQSGQVTLSLIDEAERTRMIERMQPVPAIACHITNTDQQTLSVVRVAPNDDYALIGLLSPGGVVDAIGRTDNGWFAVNFAERMGWISGSVASPQGDCNGLPLLSNPTIPAAPVDRQFHAVEVDRDGETRFREVISAPTGDTRDALSIRVINLYSAPPNNYREFTLTLTCTGEGGDQLRWGIFGNPNLRCGDSITLPFMVNRSRQSFVVTLPEDARQSFVEYELHLFQIFG